MPQLTLNLKYYFMQTYDGIWAAALAIQYVAKRKEQFLRHFEYRVKDWENIFLEALKNTSFEGVTVNINVFYHISSGCNFRNVFVSFTGSCSFL